MKKYILLIISIASLIMTIGCSGSSLNTAKNELEDQFNNVADAENEYVLMVKGAGFRGTDTTYEKAFEDYFATNTWKHFTSTDEEVIVEFTGDCMYLDTQVKARIQFVLDLENDKFKAETLSFNDVPQDNLMITNLFISIYDNIQESISEEETEPTTETVTTTTTTTPELTETSAVPSQDKPAQVDSIDNYLGAWVTTDGSDTNIVIEKEGSIYLLSVYRFWGKSNKVLFCEDLLVNINGIVCTSYYPEDGWYNSGTITMIMQNDAPVITITATPNEYYSYEHNLAMQNIICTRDEMSPTPAYIKTVEGSGLNLRTGPDLLSEIITVIPDEADIIIYDVLGGWCYVEYNGMFGYVSKGYVYLY